MGTPGAIFPVEWVGHRDASGGEVGLHSIQPSGHGTGSARAVSKSEYQWSLASRWEAVGALRRTTTEWMPERTVGEHGVNPSLLMPIGKKLHSLGERTIRKDREYSLAVHFTLLYH